MKLKALNEILPELIEGFVDDYEKGYIDRDDLIDGLATHIELEVKKRVEQLLKEIEKKENEVNMELSEILDGNRKETSVNRGALYGWGEALFWTKRLIKKAFSEVVEE